jgi:uncharacterized small protein (DUF1192 family)
MSAVYREMRYGQTPVSDGARLIFSLRCLRDVLEVLAVEKLEQRLAELERPTLVLQAQRDDYAAPCAH